MSTWITKIPLILVLLFIVGALFSAGCNVQQAFLHYPAVTTDGSGGAIVAYEVAKDEGKVDFHVQKLSPDGGTLWGEEGTRIGNGYQFMRRGFEPPFPPMQIAGDGSGGAIALWNTQEDHDGREFAVYIARIDSKGKLLWRNKLVYEPHLAMVSDGAGGAVIAWSDNSCLHVKTIGPDGEESEVQKLGKIKCRDCFNIVTNAPQGAFIVWQGDEIYAQKIDPDGNMLWEQGVMLVTRPIDTHSPSVLSD